MTNIICHLVIILIFFRFETLIMFFLLLIHLSGLLCSPVSTTTSSLDKDKLIKVQNAANIFIGPNSFIQKINEFYINDTGLSCSDKYLPIIFVMKNDKNVDQDARGFLNENGALMDKQEKEDCVFFKRFIFLIKPDIKLITYFLSLRYFVNKTTFVVRFEN